METFQLARASLQSKSSTRKTLLCDWCLLLKDKDDGCGRDAPPPPSPATKLAQVPDKIMDIAHSAAHNNKEALLSFFTEDPPNAHALDTHKSVDLCHGVFNNATCFEFMLRQAGESKDNDLKCVRCMLEILQDNANVLGADAADE